MRRQTARSRPRNEDYSDGQGRFVLEFKTDEERQFWMDLLHIDGSMLCYSVEQLQGHASAKPF
jgi:hypothetical protein